MNASTFGVLTVLTEMVRSDQYQRQSTAVRQANNNDVPPV